MDWRINELSSAFNLRSNAQRYAVWSGYNRTGLILKTGLIDVDTFLGFTGGQIGLLWQWHKFESITREQRRRYKMPDLFVWWEMRPLKFGDITL